MGGNFWARIQKFGGLGEGWDGALVMRQAYGCYWKHFLSFVLALFALGFWCIISFVLASGSHCSGRLGIAEEYKNWILPEMTFLSGCSAWYNSGCLFCVCTLVALEECTYFLRGGRLVS